MDKATRHHTEINEASYSQRWPDYPVGCLSCLGLMSIVLLDAIINLSLFFGSFERVKIEYQRLPNIK